MPPPLALPEPRPYEAYWGKANPDIHLLSFHGLDVAAVAESWLDAFPHFAFQLERWTGTPFETLRPWLLWIIALHDLGKFSHLFQAKVPSAYELLRGESPVLSGEGFRHDGAGAPAFWEWVEGGFSAPEETWGKSPWGAWGPLLNAAFQHHGRPVPKTQEPREGALRAVFLRKDQDALVAYAKDLAELFNLSGPPPDLPKGSKYASFWFAGLVVLADWIGSQESWVLAQDKPLEMSAYWALARTKATKILADAGLSPCQTSPPKPFHALFPHLAQATPTPLQALASTVPLGHSPCLAILESLTGDGKTEAAIQLIHRLMTAGAADGFYFGLPTMATANAMYERLSKTFPLLFADPALASFILAHGARNLVDPFKNSIIHGGSSEGDPHGEESSAEARCRAWLADSAKKALLAHGGVGTLDQALLAVLQARHQCLRLLGLYRKVLVVDEVHAYDPYMHRTLQELLRFHAASGGSAILLSATLPQSMRRELTEAFQSGAGLERQSPDSGDYPLLTVCDEEGLRELKVGVAEERRRTVRITRAGSFEEVVALLLEASASGKCACWIRNTVSEAMEAHRHLAQFAQDPSRLSLFHARLALGDRLDRESEVVKGFGKASDSAMRAGRILVATQVVEQSLDLDFDFLISDPAPIDLLLQRAGRLCRHIRDAEGNVLPPGSKDRRTEPNLILFCPDPFAPVDVHWLESTSKGTPHVYQDPGALWRSLRALLRAGRITMPEDARPLVEAVYGTDPEPTPDSLGSQEAKAQGKDLGDKAAAIQNTLKLPTGFIALGATWLDDAQVPTRLGDPTTTFRLARWDGERLLAWRDAEGPAAWDLSSVRVRQSMADTAWIEPGTPLAAEVERLNSTLPDKGRWSKVLPLIWNTDGGVWVGEVLDSKGKVQRIRYDPLFGLEFRKGS